MFLSGDTQDMMWLAPLHLDRPDDYEKAKGKYIINGDTLKQMKKDAIVMHPLPRVDEVCCWQSQRPHLQAPTHCCWAGVAQIAGISARFPPLLERLLVTFVIPGSSTQARRSRA
jgi:hypothetical protein